MPLDPLDLAAIGGDLKRLTDLLRTARMQIPGRAADLFATERDRILHAFDGYIEPRIGAPDAPIVAALVGSSGVGKSTLLNSIAQDRVSMTSVVRPTTRLPAVWADADHNDDYWAEFSERISRHLGERVTSVLHTGPLTEHLTIIDTPPLDMGEGADMASQAVMLADLCVFVTTPTRYADGTAWEFLRTAFRRGIPILFVLNRLPDDLDEQSALLADFAERLYRRDLLAAPDASLLFGVEEGEIHVETMGLGADLVGALRKELAEVADPVYRHGLVDETVYATGRMVAERARALTRSMAAEAPVAQRLRNAVDRAYNAEFSELERSLEKGAYGAADDVEWLTAADDLVASVTRRSGAAAQVVAAEWAQQREALDLVERRAPDLWRHGHDTAAAIRLALSSWHSGLEALASAKAKTRFLWSRRGPRVADAVWRAVLQGESLLMGRVAKWFTDRGASLLEIAKVDLAEALRAGMTGDSDRFTGLLAVESTDDPYAGIIEQADAVDVRLDGLATQMSSAWLEPGDAPEVVEAPRDRVVAIEIAEGSAIVELGGAVVPAVRDGTSMHEVERET